MTLNLTALRFGNLVQAKPNFASNTTTQHVKFDANVDSVQFGAKKKKDIGERNSDKTPSEQLSELNARAEVDFPEETKEDRTLINKAIIWLFGNTDTEKPDESEPPKEK